MLYKDIAKKKLEASECIAVVWEDIYSSTEWHTKAEIDKLKPVEIRTTGFFRELRENAIVISPSMCADGDSDFVIIPIGCILRIRRLQVRNKE